MEDFINQFLPKYKIVQKNATSIGATVLLQYGLSVLMIIPIAVVFFIESFFGNDVIKQLGQLIIYVAALMIPFMLVANKLKISVSDMVGMGKPKPEVYVMTAFVCLGISALASYGGAVIEVILNSFGLTEPIIPYELPVSTAAVAIQFLSIAIIPPIVEELCYRGVILREAAKTLGTWGAVWVSAILFCFMHESFTIIPLALTFGLLGGFLRERHGSIFPSMVGHFSVNSLYFAVNYLTYAMTEEQATPIMMAVNAVCLILGAVGVLMFFGMDGFDYERFTAFAKPGIYPKAESFRGYLTSPPFVILILIMIYRSFNGLNWI